MFKVEVGSDKVPFVLMGDYKLRLDLEDLDEKYKEKAKLEVRETPDIVDKALEKFKNLIKAERGLFLPIEDDKFLIKFLRPCKYYPESAIILMKKFYKFKIKYPKVGCDITPNYVRHVFDNEVLVFFPSRTSTGSRIMMINAGTKWNPSKVSVHDMLRAVMIAIEIAMIEPKTQIGGVHVILNMEGLTLVHIYQFSPSLAKMIVDWIQDCTPVRLKGIHIINQSFLFNMIYAIFKPFLGEKLKKRIFFHGSKCDSLCEKISHDSLPIYLGGTANIPEYPGYLFSEMVFYYEDLFKLFNTYGYRRDKVLNEDL